MLYRVSYHSMSASYGPSYIEAANEQEAKIKFGGTAFSARERAFCMTARAVSADEIKRALNRAEDD